MNWSGGSKRVETRTCAKECKMGLPKEKKPLTHVSRHTTSALCRLNDLLTQNFMSCNFVLGTLRFRDQIALNRIEEVPPHLSIRELEEGMVSDPVKTSSSRSGTDERGKCDNVGLSAACPSNEATIHSVVVAVA